MSTTPSNNTIPLPRFLLRQITSSPETKILLNENSFKTRCVPEENNSSRSFSSNVGQCYSFGENLNGSSGFSQNGGAHHNFYGRVSRLA